MAKVLAPSEPMIVRVEKEFTYHPPETQEVRAQHEAVNQMFIAFARGIIKYVPEGRELSLVITALQEARMWANAGIALNQDKVSQ